LLRLVLYRGDASFALRQRKPCGDATFCGSANFCGDVFSGTSAVAQSDVMDRVSQTLHILCRVITSLLPWLWTTFVILILRPHCSATQEIVAALELTKLMAAFKTIQDALSL
jgi:hypothetical protein